MSQPLGKPGQQTAAPAALLMHGKTNSAAHLYQTTKETGCTAEKVVLGTGGPSAPKISNQKSPGKTFKHGRTGHNAAQLTTLGVSGVRKQQFT